MGLLAPINGKILVDNKDINIKQMLIAWQKKISYVSQNSQVFYSDFYYNISLESNLTTEKKKKVENIIKIVSPNLYKKFYNNLGKKLISDGKNLSGGEIQRLAICRALYKDSLVIIFDEFTNSLDNANERKILKVVKEISKGKIIIVVSHKEEVLSICDRVINLN
jgi:ABC-type transport system involved in cytochrome bd biosynthesis fused ATPase/permease subunit